MANRPTRPRPPDRHDLAALDASLFGTLVARRENVGQKQDLFVAHTFRHLHGCDVSHWDSYVFSLAARVAAGEVRVAEQAGRRVAELLCRYRGIAV